MTRISSSPLLSPFNHIHILNSQVATFRIKQTPFAKTRKCSLILTLEKLLVQCLRLEATQSVIFTKVQLPVDAMAATGDRYIVLWR